MERIYLYSLLPSLKKYVAMAGSCSHGYQLWVHGNRDSGDYAKLSTKRSEKSIAVNVSINRGSFDGHGICFFYS